MTTEATSTEEGQAVDTKAEATTQDAPVKDDSGMVGLQADSEMSVDTSKDTPAEAIDTPLFDEVAPSEAELRGEEPTEEKTETSEKEDVKPSEEKEAEKDEKAPEGEKKADVEKPEGEKAETEAKDKEGEGEKETPEVKDEKPPAGYVPHAALHEARLEKQELARELGTLRQEVADIKAGKVEEDEEAFKVLTDEEFLELAEDDPVEGLVYQRKLDAYNKEQEVKTANRKAGEKQHDQDQQIIDESMERMTKSVPGLYEEGSSVSQDLAKFATDNGFDPAFLGLMTTPNTFVSDAKGNIMPLGNGAASLVEMLHKLHATAKTNDIETIRTQEKADAEKNLRESITAELMTKFKTQKGADFKSVGDVPGSSGDEPDSSGGFTEAQYADMTPQKREKLLGA